jgi:hypothetical protein
MAVFRVAAPCSPVEVYRRFRGACCVHHQGDILCYIGLSALLYCGSFLRKVTFYLNVK